jgi:hypothetical protein
MTERLAELLREAATAPDPLRTEDVSVLVRRRRRSRGGLIAGLTVVPAAAIAVPLVMVGHTPRATPTTGPAPLRTASTSSVRSVRHGNVSVAVPAGWQMRDSQGCSIPATHMVSLGGLSLDCLAAPGPVSRCCPQLC